jgi:hypothetical protein
MESLSVQRLCCLEEAALHEPESAVQKLKDSSGHHRRVQQALV